MNKVIKYAENNRYIMERIEWATIWGKEEGTEGELSLLDGKKRSRELLPGGLLYTPCEFTPFWIAIGYDNPKLDPGEINGEFLIHNKIYFSNKLSNMINCTEIALLLDLDLCAKCKELLTHIENKGLYYIWKLNDICIRAQIPIAIKIKIDGKIEKTVFTGKLVGELMRPAC